MYRTIRQQAGSEHGVPLSFGESFLVVVDEILTWELLTYTAVLDIAVGSTNVDLAFTPERLSLDHIAARAQGLLHPCMIGA